MPRILLADDDQELCDLLQDYLSGEDFTVDVALDGVTALKTALQGNYDGLVLDVMMPGRNGFDVLRELRAHSSLPVLMLTARGEDIDRVIGLEMGADDYLPKPFNPRELVARLRAILRRGTGVALAPEVIRVGDLELRSAERSVWCAGQPVELTGAEFNILDVLLRSAGRVVTKETLSEQALGRPLSRFDRSVDTHVSNLRKKLGPGQTGEGRIKAVRGQGYCYVHG